MFHDREDAARQLAEKLLLYKSAHAAVVVGIPRGGMVVASIISRILSLPLDGIVVKKMTASFNSELAIGAVSKNAVYWDESLIKDLKISENQRQESYAAALLECKKREKLLKRGSFLSKNELFIVVDDGVATGATVIAASLSLRKRRNVRCILATPVIASDTARMLEKTYYEKVVFLKNPKEFGSISEFYEVFPQVSTDEVLALLKR